MKWSTVDLSVKIASGQPVLALNPNCKWLVIRGQPIKIDKTVKFLGLIFDFRDMT